MFNKDSYINRREKLKANVKKGIILITGNDDSPINCQDNCYEFIQDSTFLYFYGIDRSGLFGVIDIDNNKEYIFGTDFSIEDTVWMGPLSFLKDEAIKCGIENTGEISDLITLLTTAKNNGRQIHYTNQYRHSNIINISEWLDIKTNKVNNNLSEELTYAITNIRNIKTNEEIIKLEEATNVTRDMHLTAMKFVKAGMKEFEVVAELDRIVKKYDASHSFFTICSRNGQTLHNHNHSNTFIDGDLMLLDCGARMKSGYCGDMTTTIPVSGKFSDKQRDMHNLLIEMFDKACEVMKPGVTNKAVHLEVCKILAKGMISRGLMKGNVDDAVKAGAHALFMPHGLGHMIGLDVHDMENFGEVIVGYNGEEKSSQFGLKSLRLGRTLEEGFVLTVEPGIYFIPELISNWKKDSTNSEFLNFDKIEEYLDFSGMRYEGDFIITKDGNRRLGDKMPKTADEIEAYINN